MNSILPISISAITASTYIVIKCRQTSLFRYSCNTCILPNNPTPTSCDFRNWITTAMASATVSTSNKTGKRIMPGTPVAVTIPHGNVSLFYKGQVFTSGQAGSSDGIYHSTCQGGAWKGGLDAPPICPTAHADPSAVAAISWSKAEVSVLHQN